MSKPHNKHQPDDKSRSLARQLAGVGVPQNDICIIIGVSKPTLHKHYREDLDRGLAEALKMIDGRTRGVPPKPGE